MIEFCRFVATIIVFLMLLVVWLKILWNILLPYGMIRQKEIRSVSTFPLIEIFPFVIAILLAWACTLKGWFSATNIAIFTSILIILSYMHFVLVLMVAGYVRSKRHEADSD